MDHHSARGFPFRLSPGDPDQAKAVTDACALAYSPHSSRALFHCYGRGTQDQNLRERDLRKLAFRRNRNSRRAFAVTNTVAPVSAKIAIQSVVVPVSVVTRNTDTRLRCIEAVVENLAPETEATSREIALGAAMR